MTYSGKALTLSLLVGVGFVVASCASGNSIQVSPEPLPSVIDSSTDLSALFTYTGAVTSQMVYPDIGATVDVPPVDASPGISPGDALRTCQSGESACPIGGRADVALASVTLQSAGGVAANGEIVPTMDQALVYVMTWKNIECAAVGAPVDDPAESQSRYSCATTAFVDARTGEALYGMSGPELS